MPDFFNRDRVPRQDRVYYLLRVAAIRAGATSEPFNAAECRELAMTSPPHAVNNAGNIVQYLLEYEGPPPARNDSDYRP